MPLLAHGQVEERHLRSTRRRDEGQRPGNHLGVECVRPDDENALGGIDLGFDHFTAPDAAAPSRIWRANSRYIASTGASEMPNEANTMPQSVRN